VEGVFMKGIIIYATRYGCTEKAVKLLQKKIPGGTELVNIGKQKVPDLSLYDTVILGGPIYIGKTLKVLTDFVQRNLDALKKKKLALFLCAGEQDPQKAEALFAGAFPEELCKAAFMREVFGGELQWKKLDFMTKLMLRLVIGIKEGYTRLSEGKIEKFAADIGRT
jgi:menaquinone-dependent protoporphyrinogen oxidase